MAVKRPAVLLALVTLAGLLAFGRGLGNAFVYDDKILLERSAERLALDDVARMAAQPLFAPGADAFRYYRPLTSASFALNHAAGGLSPFGFHLLNLILHLANGWLVWFLFRRLFRDDLLATGVALLFVAHPVAAETVCWVSARGDLLALAFSLAATLLVVIGDELPARARWTRHAAAWACALAAVLSKEAAAVVPGFVLAASMASERTDVRSARAAIVRLLPFFGMVLAFLGVRAVALGGLVPDTGVADLSLGKGLLGEPFGVRVLNAVIALRDYVGLYLWPRALSVVAPIDALPLAERPSDPRFLAAFAVIVPAAAAAVWAAWRWAVPRFALVWFASGYALVSGVILVASPYLVAERYLYLASVGLAGLAGWSILGAARGLSRGSPRWAPRIAAAAFALLTVGCVTRSFLRSADWKNDATLFRSAARVAPESPRALFNLAVALQDGGEIAEAEGLYLRVLESAPGFGKASKYLAEIYRGTRREADAERVLTEYLRRVPGDAAAWILLGDTQAAARRWGESERSFRQAVALAPGQSLAHFGVGRAAAAQGRGDDAVVSLRRAADLAPEAAPLRGVAGALLLDAGRPAEAVPLLEEAARLDPGSLRILNALSEGYLRTDQLDRAGETIGRALAVDDRSARAHINAGLALRRRGDLAGAEREFRRAIELEPAAATQRVLLGQVLAQAGRIAAAAAAAQEALALDPASMPARRLLDSIAADGGGD
jgi:tetratricopeptide (TPR) repeat protein